MATKVSHSSYWMDESIFEAPEDESSANLSRIIKLAAVRRAIANFVSILARENIPVEFSSGNDSYTDGKCVVIAADDDPKNFDVMVGLALHEASHILLSDFDILRWLGDLHKYSVTDPDRYAGHLKKFHPILRKVLPKFPNDWGEPSANWELFWEFREDFNKHTANIMTLMNLLEDRHIDSHVYSTVRGYRPYYDALYEKYFYTSTIGKNLKFNPQWRELTIDSYITRLLYMFHPAADKYALPGLPQLIDLMDLENIHRIAADFDSNAKLVDSTDPYSIEFDQMPKLWKEANILYAHILKFVTLAQSTPMPSDSKTSTAELGNDVKSSSAQNIDLGDDLQTANTFSDLPDLDGQPDIEELVPTPVEVNKNGSLGTYNPKTAQSSMKKASEVIENRISKKRIKKFEASALHALEEADGQTVDISDADIDFGEVMVTRKLTDSLFEQKWFPFHGFGRASEESIAAGRRMGAILTNRLQVRNDPTFTTQTRLSKGKIDRRLLAQLGMDLSSVFQRTRVDTYRPALLHLTIDASGSMWGKKWDSVVTVATALATVGANSRDVDVVITLRGGLDIPVVSVVFDSRVNKLNHFMKYIRKLTPGGSTPEGLAFKATMDMILESSQTHDTYFINFSDGAPEYALSRTNSFNGKKGRRAGGYIPYYGDFATTHTRKQVQTLRENGVKVLSYFIESSTEVRRPKAMFEKMYGSDAVFVNVTSAGEVLRTLNKRLLER